MKGDGSSVAESVIEQMGSQVDLLFTLAVAVFGGLIALIVQVTIHNSEADYNKQVQLGRASQFFIVVTLLLICASIVLGYFARGSITATTPLIFRVDMQKLDNWLDASFAGSDTLRFLVRAQVLSFIGAIASVLVLVMINLRKLGGRR
jgi:hypothetical protein